MLMPIKITKTPNTRISTWLFIAFIHSVDKSAAATVPIDPSAITCQSIKSVVDPYRHVLTADVTKMIAKEVATADLIGIPKN